MAIFKTILCLFIASPFQVMNAPNDTELSRCDRASEASEGAVGWSEMLGAVMLIAHHA